MYDIYYDGYYSKSALYDYVEQFYKGYAMQDYQFASECKGSTTDFLDQLHQFDLNVTRRFTWVDPYLLTVNMVGSQFNDMWFNCY